MVRYLANSHHVSFFDKYYSTSKTNHNDPLHLEVFIDKYKVRRVLVYGRAGLNICNLKLAKTLELFEACVDKTKSIIIKAYDDEEHSSKGIVTFPIKVGPSML